MVAALLEMNGTLMQLIAWYWIIRYTILCNHTRLSAVRHTYVITRLTDISLGVALYMLRHWGGYGICGGGFSF